MRLNRSAHLDSCRRRVAIHAASTGFVGLSSSSCIPRTIPLVDVAKLTIETSSKQVFLPEPLPISVLVRQMEWEGGGPKDLRTLERAADQIEPRVVIPHACVVRLALVLFQLMFALFNVAVGDRIRGSAFNSDLLVEWSASSRLHLRAVDLWAVSGMGQSLIVIVDRRFCHRRVLNCLNRLEHEWVDYTGHLLAVLCHGRVRSQRYIQLRHESAVQIVRIILNVVMLASLLVVRGADYVGSIFLHLLLDPLIEHLIVYEALVAVVYEVVRLVSHGVVFPLVV